VIRVWYTRRHDVVTAATRPYPGAPITPGRGRVHKGAAYSWGMSSASDSVFLPDDDVPPQPRLKPPAVLVFEDPFDYRSSDDTEEAWGDRLSAQSTVADLARFLDEKPPHHI
jgi:hypothetical protein